MHTTASKILWYCMIAGIIITMALGTVLHFVYDWSHQNAIAGFFVPVSESTWEHMKMLFYPMVLLTAVEYFIFGSRIRGLLFANTIGLLAGLTAIPLIFYTYMALLGRNFLILDIITFAVSVIIAWLISYMISLSGLRPLPEILCILILFLLLAAFMIFTYAPPDFFLFADPADSARGAK